MGKIYAAKTNHITNPVGFYLKPLVFSWKVKGCRGQEQKHARIVIRAESVERSGHDRIKAYSQIL